MAYHISHSNQKGMLGVACFLLFSFFISNPVGAESADSLNVQTGEWTLAQCIEQARHNNLQIQRQAIQVEQQKISLDNQKMRRLPDLNGSAGQSFGFGRALTSDNTYANRNTQSTSFGLSTGMPVFTGFEIQNSQKQARLNLEAATYDLEYAREQISLQVVTAYLNVLYQEELKKVSAREVENQEYLLRQVEAYFKNGKKAEADVLEARSQLEQNRLALVRADNNYWTALLDLSQLLELPSPDRFQISPAEGDTLTTEMLHPEQVYTAALEIKPQIKAEKLRLQSAETGIKIARAGFFPQISLGAGIGTSYYKTSGFQTLVFGRQLRDNFTQNISLSLSIPLFDRFQTRNAIRSARLQQTLQTIQLDDTKKQLYKEIQQAYYNARAARAQYSASQTAWEAAQVAYRTMEQKYLNGKSDATQLQNQRTLYLKATSDRVQAKYEWLLRKKILDFYAGKGWE